MKKLMKQALNNLMLIYMKLVTIFRTKSIEPLVTRVAYFVKLKNLKFISIIMTRVLGKVYEYNRLSIYYINNNSAEYS